MSRFISRRNPITAASLKRRVAGTVVVHHWWRESVRFTRTHGGWKREQDFFDPEVVSSASVARECNMAYGCKDSWAMIY